MMEVKKFPQTLTEARRRTNSRTSLPANLPGNLRGHSLSGTPSQGKIKYKK